MRRAQDIGESHLFYQQGDRRPRISHAEGIYAWEVNGRRYIDGSSGAMVSNIGHSNPRVLDAMKRQMEKATFAYRLHFENEPAEELAALTASLLPPGLDRVFFVSGGSEAVESCLKMARQYALATGQPRRRHVISLFPSYHGSTLGASAITGMYQFVEPFRDMIHVMPKIPAATCYLDRDRLSHEERGLRYAEYLREEIEKLGPGNVLAFVMEPVGGASTGALVPPDSWFRRIREICSEYGVLLIADEVMTGAGRTGRFLGCDWWDLEPDIVALGKGLGAGYAPLGAMVARRDVVDAVLEAGEFAHGFTYAGNPLSCAAGLAVVQELLENDLMANADRQGRNLRARLTALMRRYPFIGDVRGKGLLLAFELVADRESMVPLPPALGAHVELVEEAYRRGLIIYSRRTRGGIVGDHFMVCPPLIVTDEQIEELMTVLIDSLDAFAAAKGLPTEKG